MSEIFGDALAARRAASAPKRAGVIDHEPVVRLLARAFNDDPAMEWCFRNDQRKADAILDFMTFAVGQQAHAHEQVFVSPDFNAAAVWLPPAGLSSLDISAWQMLFLLPRFIGMTGWSRLTRPIALSRAMEQHHPPSPPHWYLYFIGVEPALRGRGIGSAILEATLRHVDADGAPAYLDNSNPRNTRLYERHGFRVVSEFRARAGAPPIWGMWREAKSQGSSSLSQ